MQRTIGAHRAGRFSGGVVDAGLNSPKGWRLHVELPSAGATVCLLIADDQELIGSAPTALLALEDD